VITHLPLSDNEHGTSDEREAIFAIEDGLRKRRPQLAASMTGTNSAAGKPFSTRMGLMPTCSWKR